LAKEAAVDEMMGSPQTAHNNYRSAYRLLEQLTLEPQVDEHDSHILHSAMAGLMVRIEVILQASSTHTTGGGVSAGAIGSIGGGPYLMRVTSAV